MSDALDYLMKIRPEAMKSYFDFLKKSTSHLDLKTRALISVITKVDRQTEQGFRQYLSRALNSGATPDEVIDALFAAFPTLGLSKIIWAIDIILDMNLPGFETDNLQKKPDWYEIAPLADIDYNRAIIKTCQDKQFIVYRTEKKINVYDARCPHQNTLLSTDQFSAGEITCTRHGWKFDIESGQCIATGNRPLQRYESKEKDQKLWVYW